jgi:hypothetical protein
MVMRKEKQHFFNERFYPNEFSINSSFYSILEISKKNWTGPNIIYPQHLDMNITHMETLWP